MGEKLVGKIESMTKNIISVKIKKRSKIEKKHKKQKNQTNKQKKEEK